MSNSIGCESGPPSSPRPAGNGGRRAPIAFLSHGAPTMALHAHKGEPFKRWGASLSKPKAILTISAHWEQAPPTLGTVSKRTLIYDFYGFPEPLYRIEYPAPGAPELAERVSALLQGRVKRAPDRGLDHGVWVPFLYVFPAADVPVLQLSMPSSEGPRALFELGKALSPLRDEGVLIVGSGGWVHNLRRLDWSDSGGPPPAWAQEFDAWAADVMARRDIDALLDYRAKAPAFSLAHPSEDHFLPLFPIAGAASLTSEPMQSILEGFEFGSLGRRSIQFG